MTRIIKEEADGEDLIHPSDLPLLYSKPSYSTLLSLLEKLTPSPSSWTSSSPAPTAKPYNYIPWLTKLISTPLKWLTPSEADLIISLASTNLALRAGRTALPDITRSFRVHSHTITLFEPSWTGDSIGNKTWGASLLLAQRLHSVCKISQSKYLHCASKVKCLGLGEGTGLLGISAAMMMNWEMMLTDLPCVTDNLRRNVEYNCCGRGILVKDLDWMNPPDDEDIPPLSFGIILGSDLFYDAEHPGLVVSMFERYLKQDTESRIIIEYPLRKSHISEITDFEIRMQKSFEIEHSGEETGQDDWDTQIHCKWTIYRFRQDRINSI